MTPDAPSPGNVGSQRPVSDWRSALHDLADILRITAPSIALVAIGAIAVVGSSQSIEAIRVLAEECDAGHPAALVVFVAAMIFAGLSAWYWARVLVYLLHVEQQGTSRLGELAVTHLPRICGIIPAFACAVGAFRASRFATTDSASVDQLLVAMTIGAIGIAIVLYLFFVYRHLLLHHESPQSTLTKRTTIRTLPGESRLLLAGTSFLWLGLLVAIAITHGRAVVMLGPVSILLVSIGTWIPALSTLYYAGRVVRLPLVTLLGIATFLFSFFNLNDNHIIRHEVVADRRDLPATFEVALTEWLKARQDLAEYETYPVFFVATEGGGLRAAYFTSLVLSAIQDRCPQFAQHLFAISGVSGGSVGAGIFAGLAAQRARNEGGKRCAADFRMPGQFQRLADSVLARDFLTPLFAQGLYPDMLQRALPFPVPSFDRARALEYGLERSWKHVTGGDEFARPFYRLWKTFTTGATPALFLNTTRVETGARMVESNLHPIGERFDRLVSLADIDRQLDIPLSTALGLSARFPIVTPVGGIPFRDSVFRYADGGYFDDSGATTLIEMLASLYVGDSSLTAAGRPAFVPVVIRIGFSVKDRMSSDPTRKFTSSGLNEVLSPVRTLLNTRDAHAATAVEQLHTTIAALVDRGVDARLIEFQLTQDNVPLVLGWLMATRARAEMTKQLGPARKCSSTTGVENDCSYQDVVDWLERRKRSRGPQFN